MGSLTGGSGDVVQDIILKDYKTAKKSIQADLAKCINRFKSAIQTAFEDIENKYQELGLRETELKGQDEAFATAFEEATKALKKELKFNYDPRLLPSCLRVDPTTLDTDSGNDDENQLKAFIRERDYLKNLITDHSDYIAFMIEQYDLEQVEEVLKEELAEDGRDSFFYRSVFKKYKDGLLGDLNRFSATWDPADTGGLLADVGLALKRVPMDIFTGGLQFEDIMPAYLLTGSDHVRGRGSVKASDWVNDLERSKLKGHAGPSSTTTQLLHVTSSIGGFSNKEVEAMMIALVKFWGKKTKRSKYGGGFHTAVEVWAPYTGYLEASK